MAQVEPIDPVILDFGICDTCHALVPVDRSKAHADWHEKLRQIAKEARRGALATARYG